MKLDPADLVILVPMLGRPHHVAPLLESIEATVPGARVLFLVTRGDEEVMAAIDGTGCDRLVFPPNVRGDYATKINTGYRFTTQPYIFTGASDIRFTPGWFEAAARHFGDPRIGVVGTNDVHSRRAKLPGNRHATHFLFRRSYVDEFGTLDRPGEVMPECYLHEYVDDETVGVATVRGAYAYAADSIVEHLHPYWLKHLPSDATYEQMGPRVEADAALHVERRRQWTR